MLRLCISFIVISLKYRYVLYALSTVFSNQLWNGGLQIALGLVRLLNVSWRLSVYTAWVLVTFYGFVILCHIALRVQWRRKKVESGEGGGQWGTRRRRKIFCRAPPTFLALQVQLVVFGERFRDGQYSLVSFLFAVLLLTVPPRAQPFVKVGGTCPLCPMDSAPVFMSNIYCRCSCHLAIMCFKRGWNYYLWRWKSAAQQTRSFIFHSA